MTQGFAAVATAHGAQVMGGNLSQAQGPAVIAVTVGGPLAGKRRWHRADAMAGHGIYLTGPLGDAALGYLDDDAEARQVRHQWRPHLREAAVLADWGGVGGAMDVSDGLAIDAHRMAAAAGIALHLDSACIPTSAHYRARRSDLQVALTGGEDYVLLFTAADRPPIGTRVGICRPGAGVYLDDVPLAPAGWDHFDS